MKKSTRWGLVIGVVCGAEVVGVILIGAAGLSSILHPDKTKVTAFVLGFLMVGAWIWSRRKRRIGVEARPADGG